MARKCSHVNGERGWSLTTAVLRTASRGRLRLTGADPRDPIDIDANVLDDPADLKALKICVEFCRAISNSVPLHRFAKREILPGPLEGAELEDFIRNATVSHSHQTCTAKMGRDTMSVVDHGRSTRRSLRAQLHAVICIAATVTFRL